MGQIRLGVEQDIPNIVALLNSAYRGEGSRKGWTTEADLIAGEIRSNEADVKAVMREEGSIFLCYQNDGEELIGCINLKKQGDRLYLGMFSVVPALQGKGIGGQLLAAAEVQARKWTCPFVYMYVISVRKELIDWYHRKGYYDTGKRIPFEENFTGKHLHPLEFAILEKCV
jgi:GNAT superfamily N-acetyltransferase